MDSSQRFGHTLAPKLALRHGPRQSISVNRAGKQGTLRRVPNQTASITASDIDDDKPERDGRASLLAFIAALDASARSLRRGGCGDHTIDARVLGQGVIKSLRTVPDEIGAAVGFPLIRVITARGEMLAKRHKLMADWDRFCQGR